jgi:hypothetical protein
MSIWAHQTITESLEVLGDGIADPKSIVCAGARFECGKLVERDPLLEATQAADDTPVQSPAASNQPVNNAA